LGNCFAWVLFCIHLISLELTVVDKIDNMVGVDLCDSAWVAATYWIPKDIGWLVSLRLIGSSPKGKGRAWAAFFSLHLRGNAYLPLYL
jgi:hypothetical protein